MKIKKPYSILLAFLLLVTFSMNSFAEDIDSAEFSVKASEAPSAVLEFLRHNNVPMQEDSLIYVSSEPDHNISRTGDTPLSSLCVVTKTGNQVQQDILVAFSDNTEDAPVNLDFHELFRESRAGSVHEFINASITTRMTTSYESYTSGNKTYVRPLGEYFVNKNNGGAANPSITMIQTNIVGTLYSKSGSTYTFLQNDYVYSNTYTVNSPAFNTIYSKDNALASNRVIVPDPYGNVGFEVYMEITVGGRLYYGTEKVYY